MPAQRFPAWSLGAAIVAGALLISSCSLLPPAPKGRTLTRFTALADDVRRIAGEHESDPATSRKRLARLAKRVQSDKVLCQHLVLLWRLDKDPRRLVVTEVLLGYPLIWMKAPSFHDAMAEVVIDGGPPEKLPFALRHLMIDLQKNRDLIALVAELVSDPDLAVRRSAVIALKEVRHPTHVALFDTLSRDDPDPSVRVIALRAIKADENRDLFFEASERALVSDPDPDVRIAALTRLMNEPTVGPALGGREPSKKEQNRIWRALSAAAEKDPDADVRQQAIEGIASLWWNKALPALRIAREKEVDKTVRANLGTIIESLEQGKGVFDWAPRLHPGPLQIEATPELEDGALWGMAMRGEEFDLCPRDPKDEMRWRVGRLNEKVGRRLDAGNLAEAKAAATGAVSLAERELGEEDEYTAYAVSWLGRALEDSGDLGGARPLWERALAIYEQSLGADHAETAGGVRNLAYLLWRMGELEDAERYLSRSLATYEKVLGTEDPETASTRAALQRLRGEMEERKR